MADADDYADVHDALGLLPTDPERFKPLGELSAYSPTLPERVKGGIQDLLMSGGAQAYPAGHIAGGISDLLGYLPPVAAAYAGDAMQHANSFGSAALASLGALPASKPAGIAVKTMEDLIPGYLGSAIGKMTPSEYMDSVGGVSKFAKAFPKTFRMLQPDLEDQLTASKAFQAAKAEQPVNADPLAPEKLKQVFENAWKNGEPPFSTTADYVQKQGPKQFLHNIIGDTDGPWYQEMQNKYGHWTKLPASGDLSDEAIAAKLAKNPGASIADIAGVKGAEPEVPTMANSQRDFSEHFEPLSWQEHQTNPNALADVPPWLRKQGEQLGFNFDAPLYKGGRYTYPDIVKDPVTKGYERGLFLAPNEHIASEYGKPLPYVARAKNALQVDWQKATGSSGYGSRYMTPLIEQARDQGADLLAIHNIRDIGSSKPQSQYVVLDPSILRAPNAQFDPKQLSKAVPLAGVAAGAYPVFYGSPQEESSQ